MKLLQTGIAGLLTLIGCIWLNINFCQWLFTFLPNNEWIGFLKIVIVFVDIWVTAGLTVVITVLATLLFAKIIE